jgi:hypothetical protein
METFFAFANYTTEAVYRITVFLAFHVFLSSHMCCKVMGWMGASHHPFILLRVAKRRLDCFYDML